MVKSSVRSDVHNGNRYFITRVLVAPFGTQKRTEAQTGPQTVSQMQANLRRTPIVSNCYMIGLCSRGGQLQAVAVCALSGQLRLAEMFRIINTNRKEPLEASDGPRVQCSLAFELPQGQVSFVVVMLECSGWLPREQNISGCHVLGLSTSTYQFAGLSATSEILTRFPARAFFSTTGAQQKPNTWGKNMTFPNPFKKG